MCFSRGEVTVAITFILYTKKKSLLAAREEENKL